MSGRPLPARIGVLVAVLLASLGALGSVVASAGAAAPPVRGGPVLLAQSSVPSAPSAADRRRADELRRVARDAVRVKGGRGDDGTFDDVDFGVGSGVALPLAIIVVVLLAVVGVVALARRGPRRRERADAAAVPGDDRVSDLEREARRAEEAGEHRAAVVLWFRAGTRRLRDARRVRAAETATPSEVARAAGDERVASLAVDHDRAAYGPGPVGPDASRGAREGWAVVLREPPPTGTGERA